MIITRSTRRNMSILRQTWITIGCIVISRIVCSSAFEMATRTAKHCPLFLSSSPRLGTSLFFYHRSAIRATTKEAPEEKQALRTKMGQERNARRFCRKYWIVGVHRSRPQGSYSRSLSARKQHPDQYGLGRPAHPRRSLSGWTIHPVRLWEGRVWNLRVYDEWAMGSTVRRNGPRQRFRGKHRRKACAADQGDQIQDY